MGLHYYNGSKVSTSGDPGGKIRLRGAGDAERVLKPNTTANETYFKSYGSSDSRSYYMGGQSPPQSMIRLTGGGTLQLEKNITITGETSNSNSRANSGLIRLLQTHLIMKDGATIKDYYTSSYSGPVHLEQIGRAYLWPRFTMEGGTITDTLTLYGAIYTTCSKANYPGVIIKTGGTVIGNKKINTNGDMNGIYWNGTFEAFSGPTAIYP
jgi:hypothetical protein